jgi:hypothetical protein
MLSEMVSAGLAVTYKPSHEPVAVGTPAVASVFLGSLSAMSGTESSGTGSWGFVESATSPFCWGDASAVVEDPDFGDPESAVAPAKLQPWAKVKLVIMRSGSSMAGVWLSEIVANGCGGMSSPMLAVISSTSEEVVCVSETANMNADSARLVSRKEIEITKKNRWKRRGERKSKKEVERMWVKGWG